MAQLLNLIVTVSYRKVLCKLSMNVDKEWRRFPGHNTMGLKIRKLFKHKLITINTPKTTS